jgi:hypothetical protein
VDGDLPVVWDNYRIPCVIRYGWAPNKIWRQKAKGKEEERERKKEGYEKRMMRQG